MEAASRDAWELARVRCEHGMTDFLVALDAQRTFSRRSARTPTAVRAWRWAGGGDEGAGRSASADPGRLEDQQVGHPTHQAPLERVVHRPVLSP